MAGHVTVRATILDMLRAKLLGRVAIIREDADLGFVPDLNPDQDIRLLDRIPDAWGGVVVMVASASAKTIDRDGHGPEATKRRRYELVVGVAAKETLEGGIADVDEATLVRDVYLDAIRECLELHKNLGPDIGILTSESDATQSGPGELEDRQLRNVAIGQIEVVVIQDERIHLPDPPEAAPVITVQPIE